MFRQFSQTHHLVLFYSGGKKTGGKKVLASSSGVRIVLMNYPGTRRKSDSYVMCNEVGTGLFYPSKIIRKKSSLPQLSMSPSHKIWGLLFITSLKQKLRLIPIHFHFCPIFSMTRLSSMTHDSIPPPPPMSWCAYFCFPTLEIKLNEGKDLGFLFTAVSPVPRIGHKNHMVMGQVETSALPLCKAWAPLASFPIQLTLSSQALVTFCG